VDVDDLKGNVEARTQIQVEFEQAADQNRARQMIIGRRTKDVICDFVWWLEAEDRSGASNWANQVLARCSAANCVSNAANVTGSVYWLISVVYGNIEDFRGEFDVFAAVYTDDEVNTQYRLSYLIGPVSDFVRYQNQWVKQTEADVWQLIYLGTIHHSSFTRAGVTPQDLIPLVEYQKDAADTAKLDFICLIPKDEPETHLTAFLHSAWQVGDFCTASKTDDFDYTGVEDPGTNTKFVNANLRGEYMKLEPNRENRLLFVGKTAYTGAVPNETDYEAHGASTDLQWRIYLDYLPQYISPLE